MAKKKTHRKRKPSAKQVGSYLGVARYFNGTHEAWLFASQGTAEKWRDTIKTTRSNLIESYVISVDWIMSVVKALNKKE